MRSHGAALPCERVVLTSRMLRRLRPLRPYLARYRKRYVVGFVALLVTQAVGVTAPLIIKAGIDALASIDAQGHLLVQAAASGGAIRRQLLVLALLLLGVALTKAVFQIGRAHV